MNIATNRIPATPRNKRLKNYLYNSNVSIAGSGGGGSSITNYVRLTGMTEQIIEGSVGATADIVAYEISDWEEKFPIASDILLGCIKVGNGLSITVDGKLSVTGGTGGISAINVTGSGNVITTMTLSTDGKTINAVKGDTFATQSALTSHTSDSSIHHTHSNKSVLDGISSSNISNWNTAYSNSHTHSNKSYLDTINQSLGTSYSPTFYNINANGYVRASGDIIAYQTSSGGQSPFMYWKPSVSSTGIISWTNTTSATIPTSINIKGSNGTNGQGVTYQWSGTSLRLGTISAAGSTSWGSYVNLQGITGLLSVTDIVTKTTGWKTGGNGGLYVKFSGGNGILGDSNGSIGNLYLNYVSSSYNVRIDNAGKIYSNGSQVTSDERLKTNITTLNTASIIDKLKTIDVIDYTRKADKSNTHQLGISAQQIQKVFPELVSSNCLDDCGEECATTYLSVDYATLGVVCSIGGIKELDTKIEALKTENKELKDRISKLEELL